MKNKVSVRQKPADIVIKRAAVTDITHYEYCFDNNLKNKSARELVKMNTKLAVLEDCYDNSLFQALGLGFRSSPLTESLEQAVMIIANSYR